MAKRKNKDINQIKAALLSNTDYIQQKESEPVADSTPVEETPQLIASDILFKLEALAEYEKVSTEELVNKALTHFLKLKSLQLDEAMKNKMAQSE